MTVRREIAESRRETVARSPGDPMRTRAGRGGAEERARRPSEVERAARLRTGVSEMVSAPGLSPLAEFSAS